MADKKYYWLKLKDTFFEDDTIQFIEEQENGIFYSNFYMKLCLKSIKNEGKLIRLVGNTLIPYDVKGLSKLTGVSVDTVAVAMKLFTDIGLVKILETGEIYLSQIDEMIGKETSKAESMRRLRAERKKEGNNVTEMLPKRYTEIEKEIDIELEKDIDIDRNNPSSSFNEKEAEEKKHNIEKFISILEKQFNTTIERIARDNIKRLSVLNNVNPLEAYENSDYLKGLADKKPTLSMFFKEKTYQNMKMKVYENKYNQKELVTYTDEEIRKKEEAQNEVDRLLGL